MSDLNELKAGYFRLLYHVYRDHGIDPPGDTSGMIEARHTAAHRREDTPWHDARLPTDEEEEQTGGQP